jgi:6-phosphofructokinase 1
LKEVEYAKCNDKVKRIINILEFDNPEDSKTISNPCEGDPSDRNVLHGGFITSKAFVKPDNFFFNEDRSIGFQRARPRRHIAFKPDEVKACILTCGGLCPGLNVVIRELVMTLLYNYGVRSIHGIEWGYGGIYDETAWKELNPTKVKDIHNYGGTILGTSRGGFNGKKIIDTFVAKGINMVFSIGGDGTHRGILAMWKEIESRGLRIVLAGIPKTIDNDIPIIDRSFGFESSVEQAVKAIQSANVEANSVITTA